MDISAILGLLQAHPLLTLAALAFYLYETGRLGPSLQAIIALITNGFKPLPEPTPSPTPSPAPAVDFLNQLIALLQQARQGGNKDLEEATLKLIDNCPCCRK